MPAASRPARCACQRATPRVGSEAGRRAQMRMRAVARPALPVAKRPSATSGADRAIVSSTLLTAADCVRAAQRPTRNGHRPATSCDAVAASQREPANHHSAHMYRVAVNQRHSSGTTVCALAALTQRTPWQWAERRCAAQSNTLETSASRSSQPPGPRLRGQPPKPPAKQRRLLLRATDACTTGRAVRVAVLPRCPNSARRAQANAAPGGRSREALRRARLYERVRQVALMVLLQPRHLLRHVLLAELCHLAACTRGAHASGRAPVAARAGWRCPRSARHAAVQDLAACLRARARSDGGWAGSQQVCSPRKQVVSGSDLTHLPPCPSNTPNMAASGLLPRSTAAM